jgi:hypothetical protein
MKRARAGGCTKAASATSIVRLGYILTMLSEARRSTMSLENAASSISACTDPERSAAGVRGERCRRVIGCGMAEETLWGVGLGHFWRCHAAFAVGGALSMIACGRASSKPQPEGSATAGGCAVSMDGSAGEGCADEPVDRTTGGAASSAGGTTRGGRSGRGGSSSVASGGNAATGGAGGTPPANLPRPARCQASRGAATDLLCSIDVSCDEVAQTTRCYHTGAGPWQCTCDPPHADRTYVIAGAVGLDACAVGAGLCAGPAPEATIDPSSCVVARSETGTAPQGAKTCNVELQCQRPISVDSTAGVHVTMPGSAVIQCIEAGTADPTTQLVRVDCEASGSLGQKAYVALAKGVASACHPILDLYLGAKDPPFDGSKGCVSIPETPSRPGDCAVVETCFDSAPVASGVSLVKDPSNRQQSCRFDDLGGLSCGCSFESASGEMAAISYGLGSAPRPAHCDVSQCTLDMQAVAAAPGVCPAPLYSSGQHDDVSCIDYFSCSQAATLAGKAVTLYSQLNVRCAQAKDEAYYCSCAAGDQAATFRAGTLANSVTACDTARTACLDHLALPLVPAPTAGMPPDPLNGL